MGVELDQDLATNVADPELFVGSGYVSCRFDPIPDLVPALITENYPVLPLKIRF
jgi:hypothetical protein